MNPTHSALPFTFPLTLIFILRKTQLPESHHLKYQKLGSKTLQLCSRSSVQCVRLSMMLIWQVCVFVVVLMRPLWPVSSLQSGSSSCGACCSHMELTLSGRVAVQEIGLHLSAYSTAGVSLPARPPALGWIANASHCPPPSSSLRAITYCILLLWWKWGPCVKGEYTGVLIFISFYKAIAWNLSFVFESITWIAQLQSLAQLSTIPLTSLERWPF